MIIGRLLNRFLMGAVFCATLLLTPTSAMAQQVKPEYPKITIPNPSPAIPEKYGPKGAEALRILNPHMPTVTAWYGITKEEITYSFLRWRNDYAQTDLGEWRLDNEGRIVIAEKFLPFNFSQQSDWPRPISMWPLFPLEETETLHSNQNAKITIWVSLRSNSTSASSNSQLSSTASPDDLARLQHIWQRLAENFAPFDVDVTTEKPSDESLHRSGPNDDRYGYQVIIDRSTIPGLSYPDYLEGLVYLNSFDDLDPRRRMITLKWPDSSQSSSYSQSRSYTPDMVAHMITHMLGHALGLRDEDVGDFEPYSRAKTYAGHQTSIGSWAPIMGRPGNARITQFGRGGLSGFVNQTDSIASIAKVLPLRPDEAGDTIQTAAKLAMVQSASGSTAKGSMSGIIGQQGDKDVYAIDATKKVIIANVSLPSAWWHEVGGASSNVVLEFTLLDAMGRVLESGKDYSYPYRVREIRYTVPSPGSYYLEVRAIGVERYWNKEGFSDYGSLGRYTLDVVNEIEWPQADFTFTQESGAAPLTVTFDASGTRHDRPLRYNWLFGDETPAEFGPPRISHTYSKPGFYWVAVRVVDDEGRTGAKLSGITVRQLDEITAKVDLGHIAMSKTSSAAFGTLYVVDGTGKRLPNASVRYTWSGLHQGQRSATSQAQGSPVMSLASSQKGCFVLTVTDIKLAGYSYNSAAPVTAQVCR